MKVMVCGSIGFGGSNRITELQEQIKDGGFDVTSHFEGSMDYSQVTDFRQNKELTEEIVSHDLATVESADVIVALIDKPSFGTALEMCHANEIGIPIIGFSTEPIPTPWPLYYSDFVVDTEEELFTQLQEISSNY